MILDAAYRGAPEGCAPGKARINPDTEIKSVRFRTNNSALAKHKQKNLDKNQKVVPRGGIEPPTRGFSVLF